MNYHRPCHFAEIKINEKGKIVKRYPYKNIMTPYEKLKSLDNSKQFLKKNLTFDILEKQAMEKTDLQAAQLLNQAQKKLFQTIFKTKVFFNNLV